MLTTSHRLTSCLEKWGVPFHIIGHRVDYSAQETAQDTDTPGKEFAKTVVLSVDGRYAMAVLAATEAVDLHRARALLGARDVHLAGEQKLQELFPDCEVGAEPPFGHLYGMPVYVSPLLAEDEYITFNAGSHIEVIRMKYSDYKRLETPRVMSLAL
jgi:Ala-tRNA(Pro) deacylase